MNCTPNLAANNDSPTENVRQIGNHINSDILPEFAKQPHLDLKAGRKYVFEVLKNLFLTEKKILFLTDTNHLRDEFATFFETLDGVSRLKTSETFISPNKSWSFNDFCYSKGLECTLEHQIDPGSPASSGFINTSDHSGLVIKIKNCAQLKGREK